MGTKFGLKRMAYTSLICETLVGVAVSVCLSVPSALADNLSNTSSVNSSQSPAPPRYLQAQISHTDAMSRSELSAAAAAEQVSLAPPLKPIAAPVATPNYSAFAQNSQVALQSSALQSNAFQANALQANAQNNAFNLQAAAANLQGQSDMAADVRKVEYNVDWATWLAKVADRWFFILDQYERSTQQHYVTLRPALFRFTCYNTGQIANITLKQSSGNPTYDRLQMVALIQSMPVPQFPVGTRRQTITLVQGWESHVRQAGESDYVPGSFGRGFPMEKVTEWVKSH
jgi:hypothetical protein